MSKRPPPPPPPPPPPKKVPTQRLFLGLSETVLPTLADESVDAGIMDPPASIKFMGKQWDSDKGGRDPWVQWLTGILKEVYRVLKPGGFVFVWALPRRSHWTGWAVESAGFEVRDVFHAMFATGMPKGFIKDPDLKGYGTGLKPVAEHWWIGRRPFQGGTADNIRQHGTGGFRIDDCRVGTNAGWSYPKGKGGSPLHDGGFKNIPCKATKGRYPPHIALVHAPECVDVGIHKVKTGKAHRNKAGGKNFGSDREKPPMEDMTYADEDGNEEVPLWACVPGCPVRAVDARSGGASRFWPVFRYEPKPSIKEKNAGCEDLEPRDWREGTKQSTPRSGQLYEQVGRKGKPRPNHHSTVKPVKLMRWIARLITPPGGTVIDPFNGSGTTGVACAEEGLNYIGIEGGDEDSPYWVEISRRRISAVDGSRVTITEVEGAPDEV